MIKHLKYIHGIGLQPGSDYPNDVLVSVSVSSKRITEAIWKSFQAENVDGLVGQHGDPTEGDPVELDQLTVVTEKQTVSVTVYNRGIAMLRRSSNKIRRLHRFFGVIERELQRTNDTE